MKSGRLSCIVERDILRRMSSMSQEEGDAGKKPFF